jgi:hypothetical protein
MGRDGRTASGPLARAFQSCRIRGLKEERSNKHKRALLSNTLKVDAGAVVQIRFNNTVKRIGAEKLCGNTVVAIISPRNVLLAHIPWSGGDYGEAHYMLEKLSKMYSSWSNNGAQAVVVTPSLPRSRENGLTVQTQNIMKRVEQMGLKVTKATYYFRSYWELPSSVFSLHVDQLNAQQMGSQTVVVEKGDTSKDLPSVYVEASKVKIQPLPK